MSCRERVSGGSSSKAVYAVDPHFAPQNCSRAYSTSNPSCLLITPETWRELYDFATGSGLRLVFGFNIVYGECCHGHCTGHCDGQNCHASDECRGWDSSNTRAMLQHMKETGRVPAGVLLGNEEANEVLPCRAHDLCWV